MGKSVLLVVILTLFGCNDNGKTGQKADSLGREVDTVVNKVIDSAEAKGSRLWDSTRVKGAKTLNSVKEKIRNINKKDTSK